MLHTICYFSKASEGITKDVVEEIFNAAYTNNSLKGVTGILLYAMGDFFQVLEGEKDHILPLYLEKIKKDTRHHSVFEIMNKPRQKTIFSEYSSDFNIIRTQDQLEAVKSYLREHNINTTTDKFQRLLKPFIL